MPNITKPFSDDEPDPFENDTFNNDEEPIITINSKRPALNNIPSYPDNSATSSEGKKDTPFQIEPPIMLYILILAL